MSSGSLPFQIDITRRAAVRLNGADDLLRQAVSAALTAEGVNSAQISLVLTDDAEIRRINRDFLGHDFPTDVISFPLNGDATTGAESSSGSFQIDGELIVSLETAQRVAIQQGCSLASETVLYAVHGVLHLCGYDDQTDVARSKMRQREREILRTLNLSGGNGWSTPTEPTGLA